MRHSAFPLQLAREAVFLDRFTDAVPLLKPLSSAGHADAQFLHSYLHFWDDDLSIDAAVAQLRNAADQGHVEANYLLAVCSKLIPGYTFSLPTTKNGVSRLQFAADHGSAHGKTDLAQCYLKGIGVRQDRRRARALLEQAYQQQQEARNYVPKTCYLFAQMLLEDGGEDAVKEGLWALYRCRSGYGDPLAVEAISLLMRLTEEGRYGIDPEQKLPELRKDLDDIRVQHSTQWQRHLEHYCTSTLHYDLRDVSFDDFVSFVFDHYARPDEAPRPRNWVHEARVDIDARILLRHYTQLFSEPAFLRHRYSADEIERGLGMDGIRGWGSWTLGCVITHADNTADEAETCLRAIYHLFEKLFARGGFREVAYMWWDIGYGSCERPHPPRRKDGEEDGKRLYQASFETMVRVLQINSTACHSAAIHGLGHSSHPDKERVLRQYLTDHPEISDGDRAYIIQAIAGKVL